MKQIASVRVLERWRIQHRQENAVVHPSRKIRTTVGISATRTNQCVPPRQTLWLCKYQKQLGMADPRLLERSLKGLMLNFDRQVSRKDPFEGISSAHTLICERPRLRNARIMSATDFT